LSYLVKHYTNIAGQHFDSSNILSSLQYCDAATKANGCKLPVSNCLPNLTDGTFATHNTTFLLHNQHPWWPAYSASNCWGAVTIHNCNCCTASHDRWWVINALTSESMRWAWAQLHVLQS